jgi:hypothetical protein
MDFDIDIAMVEFSFDAQMHNRFSLLPLLCGNRFATSRRVSLGFGTTSSEDTCRMEDSENGQDNYQKREKRLQSNCEF